ncbi:hypothetical protein [Legionella sp. km772]|uniref:hypothetical protein n=1 Tax=Legionella sp. km772 TaxID=2498111 RepID=UPI000F8E7FCF|nr:hypothetical protein [Legionella sp. km772]RUR06519.1 hypothetical protein ELY15_13085 [Legionella sp. km772]
MFKLTQYLPLVVKPYQQQVQKKGPDTYYSLEYLLPKGDKLRVIASPDKKNTRLILFTYQAELIKYLPGPRSSSLVAEIINKVNHYRLLSNSYTQPRGFS